MRQNDISQKAAIATRWSTITEIVAKLIAPVTNILLARLLTPEAFGIVATITIVISFAEMFADSGFQKFLIQHEFESKRDLDESTNVAFWTNLAVSLLAWSGIIVFREQIAVLVGNPGLGNVLSVAAFSLPLTSFSSIQMARYKRRFDFKTLFYVRTVSVCMPLFVTVPLAYITRDFWALVIGTLVGNILNALILTWRSEWKPSLYYSVPKLKDMFSYSCWILLESITVWLTSYIDIFIVSATLSAYYVGIYKTGMMTANQIMGLVTAATSAPLFSALSALHNSDNDFKEVYYKYIQAISIFLVPLGIGIFLYRELVTLLLLGKQWHEAVDFIGLWALTNSFCLVFGTYCSGVYNAKGKPKFSCLAQILTLIVLIPVLIVSSHEGFKILYISRSFVRFEFIFVQLTIVKYFFDISPIRLINAAKPSFIASLVMAVWGYLSHFISATLLWQLLSACICVVVYFAFLRIVYSNVLYKSLCTLGFNLKLKIRMG